MSAARSKASENPPLAPISKGSAVGMVELVATFFGLRDDTGHKLHDVGEIMRFPIPPFPRGPRYLPSTIIDRWTFEWVQITSPRVLRELYTLRGDEIDHEAPKGFLRPMFGVNSPFLLNGPGHAKVRQAVVPELRAKQVEQYRRMSVEVLDRMIDELPLNQPINLHDFFTDFAQEVIVRALFGFDEQHKVDQLRTWLKRCTAHALGPRVRLFTGLLFWPAMRPYRDRVDDIPRWPFRAAHTMRRETDELLYRTIAELRAAPNDSMASRLIARSADDPFWTDKVLRDTFATLLVAGHHTSVSAYSWAAEYLLNDDDARAKLVDEAMSGQTDQYAQACAKEALRLKPPVWGAMAMAREDVALSGYRVRKGSFLFATGRSVHVDEQVYPDPLAFRPERFLPDDPSDRYSFISFSLGRHRCPGTSFFYAESGLLLHRLFGRVRFEPQLTELDRTFMDLAFFNRPRRKVPVIARERRPARDVPIYSPTHAPDTDDIEVDEVAYLTGRPNPGCPFAGNTTSPSPL